MCFRRKYQERVKITEYPLHQLIPLGRLEIHIALSNPNIDVRIFAQGCFVANTSLSYFEHDVEQDEIRKALLMILLLFAKIPNILE